MKTLNTQKVLVSFKGEHLKEDEKEVIVGTIISNILAGQTSNPTLAWQLGKKIATEKAVDLKAEDIVFIKKCIEECKWVTSLVAGQVIEILDSKDEVTPSKGKK